MSVIRDSSNFTIRESTLNNFERDATFIQVKLGDGSISESERHWFMDFMAGIQQLVHIPSNEVKRSLSQLITNLPYAKAAYNDYLSKKGRVPCFLGTRESLLKEVGDWLTILGAPQIYVLSGLAGIGKSTIAQTVAERADKLRLLGASFFFSRDGSDRRTAEKFFTTIAFQLCVFDGEFADAIEKVLGTDQGKSATTKEPQEQLEVLILEPLRDIVQQRPRKVIIVVDALDECDEQDGPMVLEGLDLLVHELPSFKVFVTTRPQPHLYPLLIDGGAQTIFHLQNIEDKVVNNDIRLYLEHRLSSQQVKAQLPMLRRAWAANSDEITSLVNAADKLFIIASTAVLFVLDKVARNPGSQMRKLLSAFAQDRTPFNTLNNFYSVILRVAVPLGCDHDIVERFQAVIGAIVLVQDPLHAVALANLVEVEIEDVYAVLDNLQAVVLLEGNDIPVIYHKSFTDYLTDPTRCKEVDLLIDRGTHHTRLAIRSFQTMRDHLRQNILCLGDPARFMTNVAGLEKQGITDDQYQVRIPRELRYACVYWAKHTEGAHIKDTNLVRELETFMNNYLLHWFEALSWIRKLDSTHGALRVVLTLFSTGPADLCQLAFDGLRFISKFYDIIAESALHIYYSALPFVPTDKLFYQRYKGQMTWCRVQGGEKEWDTTIAIMNHGEGVEVVQFSQDNTKLASFGDESMKFWDATTGIPIRTIRGGGFVITPDFLTAASLEGKDITLYDMKNIAPVASFKTPEYISRLGISPDGRRLASGMCDGTIHLWDTQTKDVITRFDHWRRFFPDQGEAGALTFSPDGDRLAFTSTNGSIQLRNGTNGKSVGDLRYKSEIFIKLVFSTASSRLACLSCETPGSFYKTLTLWNAENAKLVGAVSKIAHTKLAISTDGSFLATVAFDDVISRFEIKLWSGTQALQLVETLGLRPEIGIKFSSLKFSRQNILAIGTAGSMDGPDKVTLYDVENRSYISTLSFKSPTTMAFSSTSSQFAAGNSDGSVYLWDVRSFEASDNASNERLGSVTALALSPSCSRVASGHKSGCVKLWDASNALQRIAFHRVHSRGVTNLEFGKDGEQFASVSDDLTIRLWDGRDGTPTGIINNKFWGWVGSVRFSSGMLAVGMINEIVLCDLTTYNRVHNLRESRSRLLAFSQQGSMLASFNSSGYDKTLTVWDVERRSKIATFPVDKEIEWIEFSPDDIQLVAQFRGAKFQSFQVNDGKEGARDVEIEEILRLYRVPRWHGIPIWLHHDEFGPKQSNDVVGRFSQHEEAIPVLRTPTDLDVVKVAHGFCKIALGCRNGHILLLEP